MGPFQRVSGLNRVVGHISLLRTLDEQFYGPNFLTGVGLSAIIAAQYSSGMTASRIEWHYFRFIASLKKTDLPFDKNWLKKVKIYLIDPIDCERIEKLKKLFYLPLYDTKQRTVILRKTGDLKSSLVQNLQFTGEFQQSALGQRLSLGTLKRELQLASMVASNALGEAINLELPQSFTLALYGKMAALLKRNDLDVDFTINLGLEEFPLDDQNSISKMMALASEQSQIALPDLKNIVMMEDVTQDVDE